MIETLAGVIVGWVLGVATFLISHRLLKDVQSDRRPPDHKKPPLPYIPGQPQPKKGNELRSPVDA